MANSSYLVLARKWRPQSFEDVVGQEHITRTLQNAIRSGRIGHAFLFIGTRGIGKTTTARILAKALNCLSSEGPTPEPCGTCQNCVSIAGGSNIDVIEIDGASNNKVEDVHDVRESIRMVPSHGRYKIYIIDEVHQLSSSAFNALLKTLEEPPAHAIFVLATTEAHKVPATIMSRCQRYDFRRVGLQRTSELLRNIMDNEGVVCSEEALYAIARSADGSVRDAQSILEQVISFCGDSISYEDVFDVLGLVDWKVLHDVCNAILSHDVATLLGIVEEVVISGRDLSQFVQDMLQYFRNLLVCKTADPNKLLALPDHEIAEMQSMAEHFTLNKIISLVEQFAELSKDFDSQLAQRIALEALFIRMSKVSVEVSVDSVLEKLLALGAGGIQIPDGAPSVSEPSPIDKPEPPNPPKAASHSVPHQPAAQESEKREKLTNDEASEAKPLESRNGLTITENNMREFWTELAQQIGSESLNIGVVMGQAVPSELAGSTLVLDTDSPRQRDTLERSDSLSYIADALKEKTSNLDSIRVRIREAVSEKPGTRQNDSGSHAPSVSVEDARQAMADPHIAAVVELFRGSIVEIKEPELAADRDEKGTLAE